MSWRIEQHPLDRIGELALLIGEIEARPVSVKRWRRKYAHAGDAGPGVALVLYEGERLMGVGGAIFYRLRAPAGEPWLGAQLCDFIIRPEARRQKRFLPLGEAMMAELAARGCDLVFGFANPRSEGFLREQLGFRTIGVMDCYEMPLATLRAIAPLRRAVDKLARSFGRAGGVLPAMPMAPGEWGCEHGPGFLAARQMMGARVLRVAGKRVLAQFGPTLTIGAIETDAIDPMLTALGTAARARGAERVRFMVQRGTRLAGQLEARLGLSPGGWHIVAHDLAGRGAPLERLRFWFADYEGF